MTARHVYALFCDAASDCVAIFAPDEKTCAETRRLAALEGWSHILVPTGRTGPAASIDLCPAHKGAEGPALLADNRARKNR